MFYLNAGSQWKILDGAPVDGIILTPSRIDNAERRLKNNSYDIPSALLFDPQVYLVDYTMSPSDDKHRGLLKKLVEYPWFGMRAPVYESDQHNRNKFKGQLDTLIPRLWRGRSEIDSQWRQNVDSALNYQRRIGVDALILPAHAIKDPEDPLGRYVAQLDDALTLLHDSETEFYATIAVDKDAIRHREPSGNDLVESLADVIHSRGIPGVYIALTSSRSDEKYPTTKNVVANLMYLVRLLGTRARVVVNFAAELGLYTLGFGAHSYASSYRTKGRRFLPGDFEDLGYRPTVYPKFHSARFAADFVPKDDLESVRDGYEKGLKPFEDDWTPESADLRKVLQQNGNIAAELPEWRKERGVHSKQCRLHYMSIHRRLAARRRTMDETISSMGRTHDEWTKLCAHVPSVDDVPISTWLAAAKLARDA